MELPELAWPAVAALPKTTPVVFPIAALEQHGRHMPVFTDSLLLGEVLRRVKLAPVAAKCLFAPLQWLGNSHHHLDFPGTLSASARVYLDLLKDLARCFIDHGFTRIVFVNGHGGNIVPQPAGALRIEAGPPQPPRSAARCRSRTGNRPAIRRRRFRASSRSRWGTHASGKRRWSCGSRRSWSSAMSPRCRRCRSARRSRRAIAPG